MAMNIERRRRQQRLHRMKHDENNDLLVAVAANATRRRLNRSMVDGRLGK
jgi:hypothetical protein